MAVQIILNRNRTTVDHSILKIKDSMNNVSKVKTTRLITFLQKFLHMTKKQVKQFFEHNQVGANKPLQSEQKLK